MSTKASTGADYVQDDVFDYTDGNAIKNCHAGTTAPTAPVAGVLWLDTSSSPYVLKVYSGSAWLSLAEVYGMAPVGTITAWIGGYFGDGSNGSYTRVLGSANTVAGANGYLNSLGWYVCSGAALNDGDSPIYNGAGRYLPNLSDDRFLQGDTAAGSIGGANTNVHTHDVDIVAFNTSAPSATLYVQSGATQIVPSATHTHEANPPNTTSGAASDTENRPQYLACFYIQRVK